ncbi:MAG: methyl-accepting chemotaxis protein [Nanoarchaeota archaeon]
MEKRDVRTPACGEYAPGLDKSEYHPVLRNLLDVAPFFGEALGDNLLLLISSPEKYLYYKKSQKIPLNLIPGNRPKPNGGVNKALKAGHRIVEMREREEATFWLMSYPVFSENNEMVGNIIIGVPMDKEKQLKNLSNEITKKTNEAAPVVNNVIKAAEEISTQNQEIENKFSNIKNECKSVGELLGKIRVIADKSKMLSINASIEAAREGGAGSGFGVVANEMQELSGNTQEIVNNINSGLEKLNNTIEAFSIEIETNMEKASDQLSVIKQLDETMKSLKKVQQELEKNAKEFLLN